MLHIYVLPRGHSYDDHVIRHWRDRGVQSRNLRDSRFSQWRCWGFGSCGIVSVPDVSFSLDCLTFVGDGIRVCRNICNNSPSDAASNLTGRFIMFSVITNIYNKKTNGPALMEFFTATGKLEKVPPPPQLEMFELCTTGDTAHIDTLFKFLSHTRQNVDACVTRTWISCRCVPCHTWCTIRTSLVGKKKPFSSFPVAVKNSIKAGPLVFLL